MRVAASLLALIFVGCASAAVSKPSLRVVSRVPLTVEGERFHPGERVVVTALTGYGPKRQTVVATHGSFRVPVGSAKGCGATYAVKVVGSDGSRASLVLGEAPVCVPPPRD